MGPFKGSQRTNEQREQVIDQIGFLIPKKGFISSDFNHETKRKLSDMFTCSMCIIHEFRCVLGPFVNLEPKGGGASHFTNTMDTTAQGKSRQLQT